MTQYSMFSIETAAPKMRKVTFSNPPVNVVGRTPSLNCSTSSTS
jgi:hypothetical protein